MRLTCRLLMLGCCAQSVRAQPPHATVPGSPADIAAIRTVLDSDDDASLAPDFDWENAFGVRFTDPRKMHALLSYVHGVLQAKSSQESLETKIAFLAPDMAVADRYEHIVGQIDQKTNKVGADRWIRATTVLRRDSGHWTEVLERVADLRLPYYRHYTAIPAPAAVPQATLSGYAGDYVDGAGKVDTTVALAGDRLRVRYDGKSREAIPTSATEFLVFDPADLERYSRLRFGRQSDGRHTLAWSTNTGEAVGGILIQHP